MNNKMRLTFQQVAARVGETGGFLPRKLTSAFSRAGNSALEQARAAYAAIRCRPPGMNF